MTISRSVHRPVLTTLPSGCRARFGGTWLVGLGWTMLAVHALHPASTAQKPSGRRDKPYVQPTDPYTHNKPENLRKLGYRSYGPFAWGKTFGTDHIVRTLGDPRIRWVETEHFKLGCGLSPRAVPGVSSMRRPTCDELTRLKEKLPDVEPRTRSLDRWLLMHLFAHRLERLYREFSALIGVTDDHFPSADGRRTPGRFMGKGPFLGMRGKYCVILFNERSQLERYLRAFAGLGPKQTASSHRYLDRAADSMVFATAAECFDKQLFGDLQMHNHVIGAVVSNLLDGYKGRITPVPAWLGQGLGHWFRRRIDPRFNILSEDIDPVEEPHDAWRWGHRVRGRVQHDYFPKAIALLADADVSQWKQQTHMMSWSRVDFLVQHDAKGLRRCLDALKDRPIPLSRASKERKQTWQERALRKGWDLTLDGFDSHWKQFVLKTYPK